MSYNSRFTKLNPPAGGTYGNEFAEVYGFIVALLALGFIVLAVIA